ncbi:MAG: nuclear transport factor 2 family protein [Myxococcaceae bacterium]
MADSPAETRIERIVGAPLADDAVRQWPQSGEILRGRARIAEVESHFPHLKLALGKRYRAGDRVFVEWSTEYGDGRIYRNVTIAELRDGSIVKITDYWGEPFDPPDWRRELSDSLETAGESPWPGPDALAHD